MTSGVSAACNSPIAINPNFYKASKAALADVRKINSVVPDYFAVAKLRIEAGNASWRSLPGREIFDTLLKKHVEAIWEQHLQPKGVNKILELGAGFLDNEGQSFLSAKFPEKLAMTFTDLNIAAVRESKRRNYTQIDSTMIGETFNASSFDAVVGSCFIDNLPSPDLLHTLKGMHFVLKQGGLFFHISDLQPLIDTIIADFRNHDDILFPWTNEKGFFQGLQLVPKNIYKKFAENTTTTEDIVYLKEYFTLSNKERGMLIITLFQNSDGKALSDLCTLHFGANAKKIKNNEYFSNNLSINLERANFRILKNGVVSKQEVYATAAPEELNDIACFHGNILKNKVNLPELNSLRVTLGVHVIVAEKL